MRILTVRQPWAWAIIHGKDIENRSRSLGPYRGPVAIHVSRRVEPPGEPWSLAASIGMDTDRFDGDALHLGCVIGVVDLVSTHPDCTEPVDGYGLTPTCSTWAMPDHHHLVLSNPRPLPRPIPATGRLGLWRPDDALLAAITEQLGEVA